MCGIVGYIGDKDAVDIIVQGLRRLEYRGYDSAGVAVIGPRACRCGGPRAGSRCSKGSCASGPARHRRHRPHPLGHPRPAHR